MTNTPTTILIDHDEDNEVLMKKIFSSFFELVSEMNKIWELKNNPLPFFFFYRVVSGLFVNVKIM